MNEEIKHGHGHGEFEREDLTVRAILISFAGLAAAVVLVYFVALGLYGYLDRYTESHEPAQNPLAQKANVDTRLTNAVDAAAEVKSNFPQPRLEQNERMEINEFRLHEEKTLASYGWVDEKAGVVRIPIDRAMQLTAQRGLLTTPKAGTVPPSEVNVVSQAAQRADTSNQAAKKPRGKGKQ